MAEEEDGKENRISERLTAPPASQSDLDIEEIIISKR